MKNRHFSSAGFSLAEVVIAMLVLAIGLLGMAAGTGWMIRSVDLSKVETARTAATQEAIEFVRAIPWDDLGPGERSVGDYQVRWTIGATNVHGVQVDFALTGPGRQPGEGGPMPVISSSVTDNFSYWRIRP